MVETINKLMKATRKLTQEKHRDPTPEEIAQNPDKYQAITNQELLDYRA
jgi:DNA-directed RNA polymerase sigma subunit (sigma70/sigma32)